MYRHVSVGSLLAFGVLALTITQASARDRGYGYRGQDHVAPMASRHVAPRAYRYRGPVYGYTAGAAYGYVGDGMTYGYAAPGTYGYTAQTAAPGDMAYGYAPPLAQGSSGVPGLPPIWAISRPGTFSDSWGGYRAW